MVETTGLADPPPVAMTFLGSDLRNETRLDSIITVIDAENFGEEILDTEVAGPGALRRHLDAEQSDWFPLNGSKS